MSWTSNLVASGLKSRFKLTVDNETRAAGQTRKGRAYMALELNNAVLSADASSAYHSAAVRLPVWGKFFIHLVCSPIIQ
jgi:hypothetical protein